jgi:hypothetical protein
LIPGELRKATAVVNERLEQASPRGTVGPEALDGAVKAAVGDSRPTTGKRMSVGDLGHREFDPALESELLEELRRKCHRVHR